MATGELCEPVKEVKDKWKLLPHFLKLRGLMRQHIDSFNFFVNKDIKNIVQAASNREVGASLRHRFGVCHNR